MSRYQMHREDTWDIYDDDNARIIATFHCFEHAVEYMAYLKDRTAIFRPEYEVDGFKYSYLPQNVLPKTNFSMRLVSDWFTHKQDSE